MVRAIVWVIAFLPLVVMFVLALMGGEFAGWAMALSFVAGPIFLLAALIELVWFGQRGAFIRSNPAGSKRPWFFCAILLLGIAWEIYRFVVKNH